MSPQRTRTQSLQTDEKIDDGSFRAVFGQRAVLSPPTQGTKEDPSEEDTRRAAAATLYAPFTGRILAATLLPLLLLNTWGDVATTMSIVGSVLSVLLSSLSAHPLLRSSFFASFPSPFLHLSVVLVYVLRCSVLVVSLSRWYLSRRCLSIVPIAILLYITTFSTSLSALPSSSFVVFSRAQSQPQSSTPIALNGAFSYNAGPALFPSVYFLEVAIPTTPPSTTSTTTTAPQTNLKAAAAVAFSAAAMSPSLIGELAAMNGNGTDNATTENGDIPVGSNNSTVSSISSSTSDSNITNTNDTTMQTTSYSPLESSMTAADEDIGDTSYNTSDSSSNSSLPTTTTIAGGPPISSNDTTSAAVTENNGTVGPVSEDETPTTLTSLNSSNSNNDTSTIDSSSTSDTTTTPLSELTMSSTLLTNNDTTGTSSAAAPPTVENATITTTESVSGDSNITHDINTTTASEISTAAPSAEEGSNRTTTMWTQTTTTTTMDSPPTPTNEGGANATTTTTTTTTTTIMTEVTLTESESTLTWPTNTNTTTTTTTRENQPSSTNETSINNYSTTATSSTAVDTTTATVVGTSSTTPSESNAASSSSSSSSSTSDDASSLTNTTENMTVTSIATASTTHLLPPTNASTSSTSTPTTTTTSPTTTQRPTTTTTITSTTPTTSLPPNVNITQQDYCTTPEAAAQLAGLCNTIFGATSVSGFGTAQVQWSWGVAGDGVSRGASLINPLMFPQPGVLSPRYCETVLEPNPSNPSTLYVVQIKFVCGCNLESDLGAIVPSTPPPMSTLTAATSTSVSTATTSSASTSSSGGGGLRYAREDDLSVVPPPPPLAQTIIDSEERKDNEMAVAFYAQAVDDTTESSVTAQTSMLSSTTTLTSSTSTPPPSFTQSTTSPTSSSPFPFPITVTDTGATVAVTIDTRQAAISKNPSSMLATWRSGFQSSPRGGFCEPRTGRCPDSTTIRQSFATAVTAAGGPSSPNFAKDERLTSGEFSCKFLAQYPYIEPMQNFFQDCTPRTLKCVSSGPTTVPIPTDAATNSGTTTHDPSSSSGNDQTNTQHQLTSYYNRTVFTFTCPLCRGGTQTLTHVLITYWGGSNDTSLTPTPTRTTRPTPPSTRTSTTPPESTSAMSSSTEHTSHTNTSGDNNGTRQVLEEGGEEHASGNNVALTTLATTVTTNNTAVLLAAASSSVAFIDDEGNNYTLHALFINCSSAFFAPTTRACTDTIYADCNGNGCCRSDENLAAGGFSSGSGGTTCACFDSDFEGHYVGVSCERCQSRYTFCTDRTCTGGASGIFYFTCSVDQQQLVALLADLSTSGMAMTMPLLLMLGVFIIIGLIRSSWESDQVFEITKMRRGGCHVVSGKLSSLPAEGISSETRRRLHLVIDRRRVPDRPSYSQGMVAAKQRAVLSGAGQ